ncbi:MAG: hypothetical protein LIP09_04665 [Bacteroidales bacterium]|nr:hypothetical protein [Bacteroidales bacterium]
MADNVMEERPDSALAILAAIDPSVLASPEENARYALLLTQAQVKNGYIIDNDSLISKALEFYKTKKNSNELMRSLFYDSEVGYNQGSFVEVIQSLMEAEEMASNKDNCLWLAKIEEMIGDIYSNMHNQEEWAEYSMKASNLYKKIGKERNHRFLLIDHTTALSNKGNITLASELIDSVISLAQHEPADTALLCYGLKFKISLFLNNRNNKDAIDCYDRLSKLGITNLLSANEEARLAQAYIAENLMDQANWHIQNAQSHKNNSADEAAINMVWADYNESNGEYKLALDNVRKALDIQNTTVNYLLRESIAAEQRDFYNLLALKERQNTKEWKNLFVVILVFTTLFTFAIIICYRLNQKVQKSKLEAKIHDIYRLNTSLTNEKNHLKRLTQKNEEMEKEMETLFKKQWSTLNFLCNQYFDKDSEQKLRETITKEIKKEIEKLKNSDAQLEMERAVNRYMGNIIDVMKQECPFLKPRDIKFLTFEMAGFSPTAVCIYTDITIDYFYLKRSNLIKKINNSAAEHKDWFLSKLPKKK